MIELDVAENILKSAYIQVVADALDVKKNPVCEKVVYRGNKPYEKKEAKTGRNELCPCGSGKKYKRCCGVDQ